MGFKNPRRTARLIFDKDSGYEGAEITCSFDVSLGAYFDFSGMGDDPAKQRESFMRFGDELLIDWNLEEDDGTAIPATGKGFLDISAPFAMAIIKSWAEAISDVPAPLDVPSNNGVTSGEPLTMPVEKSASPSS